MTSIQYKITPEDLFRSVQYTRLQTELSIIEERLQATAPEEISAEDGFFKRGFRRVKNRLKNTAAPSLEEKRQATLKKLDGFFCAHSTADIRILERGEENRIRPIPAKEALLMLMQQSNRPRNPKLMPKYMELIDALARKTSFYRLACNMEPDAARVAYETMSGKERT
jgi:hypothetical protein